MAGSSASIQSVERLGPGAFGCTDESSGELGIDVVGGLVKIKRRHEVNGS